ncbi:hypothetical protein ANN_06764 [Periplaneta americana]|uniref:Uncharacterized protein n=1 Tax=Periplaneta americana TaxID=6978 RepID=A0ABQ8TGH5_PERAM|nr:hypothetical protein ANN_06764 [Periplaneta americana]
MAGLHDGGNEPPGSLKVIHVRGQRTCLSPNPQAGGPPLIGCPRLLIQYIRRYPPYLEAVSSIRKLRTRHTEIYLQQLNISTKLENLNDPHVNAVRDYETIRTRCLSELQVIIDEATGSVKQLRQHLRHREFRTWSAYPQKRKVDILFEEVFAANPWIIKNEGLSSSEWREMLKMNAMVAPVHSLTGRSTGMKLYHMCLGVAHREKYSELNVTTPYVL